VDDRRCDQQAPAQDRRVADGVVRERGILNEFEERACLPVRAHHEPRGPDDGREERRALLAFERAVEESGRLDRLEARDAAPVGKLSLCARRDGELRATAVQ
jgi:hypothetical protein